jgi:hypothetical protein
MNKKIDHTILDQENGQVASMFSYWRQLMDDKIKFWQINDGIDIHTEGHCERVLLLALKLGEKRHLKLRSLIALCHASIFHDTRRKDNYLDRGHGQRAAEYYKQFCTDNGLKYLPEVYAVIAYHDQDDEMGEKYIREEAPRHSLANAGEKTDDTEGWLEVYHDFKDADALDRYRLGPWGLDAKFLRSNESKELMEFAQHLVTVTIDPELLKDVTELTRPYAERIAKGE